MKQKRILALGLALLLLFVLAACSANEGATPTATPAITLTPTPTATPAAATPSEAPVPSETPQAAPSTATPLLWAVQADGEDILYLFGTIHVARETVYPLPTGIQAAFDRCTSLAVEVDIRPEIVLTKQAEIAPLMTYTDGRTLEEELGEELFAQMVEALSIGLPGITGDMLQSLRPFAAHSLLTNVVLLETGLSTDLGLDNQLLMMAAEDDKEILEVETLMFQTEMLAGFSDEVQRYLIESTLDISANAEATLAMYDVWEAGDEAALMDYALIDPAEIDEQPALESYVDGMYTQRNTHMADTAEAYIAEGKKVFFAVGAGHMVGEGGIVDLLRERGYTVEQVVY